MKRLHGCLYIFVQVKWNTSPKFSSDDPVRLRDGHIHDPSLVRSEGVGLQVAGPMESSLQAIF